MTPQYDWRAMFTTAVDHNARANQHRPTDPAAIQREVRRLAAQGLHPRDIAELLELDLVQVIETINHTHHTGETPQ